MKGEFAVFGFINKNIGGLCSGHYLAIRELAAKGYNLLFIEWEGWLEAGDLANYANVERFSIQAEPQPLFRPFCSLVKFLQKKTGLRLRVLDEFSKILVLKNIGRQIREELKKRQIKILLVAGIQNYWKMPGIKVVSWTQGPIFGEGQWLVRHPKLSISQYGLFNYIISVFLYFGKAFLDRIALGRSSIVICGSYWARKRWISWGCNPQKVRILPYAYRADAPRVSPPVGGEKSFLHLGRIVPRKRLELLLDAFRDPRLWDCKLTLVGRIEFPRAKRLIQKLPPNIRYYEQVPFQQVDALVRRNKFLIQVSENENLGSSVMEAMAIGVPVILCRKNGTSDYVPNEEWHFFNDYTREDLVEGVLRATSVTLGLVCDNKAIENHRKFFSPEEVGNRLEQILVEGED